MRTILIPTDFSKNAQNATDFGIAMLDGPNTEFILLNTYYIPYASTEVSVSTQDVTAAEAEKKFDLELKRVNKAFPNAQGAFKTRFAIGDVVNVVRHINRTNTVEAVVMGTQGASGLAAVLVGSRTVSMIKRVNCPVYAIPSNAKFRTLKKILFTTDLELMPEDTVLKPLIELAKNHQSHMSILHIAKEGDHKTIDKTFIEHELNYQFLDLPHDFESTVGENISAAIEDYTKEHQVDLVAMISPRGNLFHRIFHRSITKKLALHADTPMLVLHSDL